MQRRSAELRPVQRAYVVVAWSISAGSARRTPSLIAVCARSYHDRYIMHIGKW
jgi:hypothetical protein